MGKRYPGIDAKHIEFIERQHLFFVATATAESRINLSPKGLDSLRILDGNRVVWLNLTGSGNETIAHLQSDERMTIMFCAFEGEPKILRLYGRARTILPDEHEWHALFALFEPLPGARQIFDMHVDLVQTSCGFGVPLFDFIGDRDMLNAWAEKKEKGGGIARYWRERNNISLDGEAIRLPADRHD